MLHDEHGINAATERLDLQVDDRNNNEFICGVVEGFYGKPWTLEQRKDLFKKLKEFKLNTFMYAPKDDAKHRAKWRQLYSPTEEQELKTLIDQAKNNGIEFYYSLAPGLDMIYSDDVELQTLVRKYDQLVSLGCSSFAILFDDIEPTICNDKDRGVFKNYAHAQVLVTNHIYQYLKRPKFLFCPTEYCESRAVPNVTDSIYLQTLGSGLSPGIDIMWSGSRVISKFITEESIDMLAKVIRRPPVIWENLHANDYDKKRIFLGPYSGRSTKIIPNLRGVLTNPNCEYEANYIAIHTLAQWSRCKDDVDKHNSGQTGINQSETMPSAQQISIETVQQNTIYDPERALSLAILDWLPQFWENKPMCDGQYMLVNPAVVENHSQDSLNSSTTPNSVYTCMSPQDLSLLVDLFYLPFQHGSQGEFLLKTLRWLKVHSECVIGEQVNEHDKETPMNQDGDECMIETDKSLPHQGPMIRSDSELWFERAEKLNSLCASVATLVNLLYECPNKMLTMELYPYLADARDMTTMIIDYIKFLRCRRSAKDQFNDYSLNGTKTKQIDAFCLVVACNDDQEPWVYRGGLIGDVYRLLST